MVSQGHYFLTACLLFSLMFSSNGWAADFSASVDRKNISENDTFSLVLRYGEQIGFGSPDLTPLENDFQVLNQQRSNQFRSINGRSESFTEWTLTLTPKRTGKLMVPAISFQSSRTTPIAITVSKLSAEVKKQLENEFFFDTQISEGPYYVQGQIIYQEKLYYSVNHEDPTLSDFKVTDARVQQLGEVRSYQTVVDGQRLGVYERRYAIFPEESGELVIPGQRFNARVTNPYDRWGRGRQAGIVSKPQQLEVQPIPATYPQAPWLPSQRLTISEHFSNDDNSQWTVGEPVTRTISITAQGLSGSQIPAVALPVVDKIRYYPDQSNNSESINESGLLGTLEQSMAIVPTEEGRLILPEIRIPWWNTRLGTLEYAVLPSRTIQVQAAANHALPSEVQTIPLSNQPATAATTPSQGYWIIASALLLLSNFVFAYLLWREKNQLQPTDDHNHTHQPSTKQLWKNVKHACQSNDPAAIRQTAILWVNQLYPEADIHTLDQVKQLSQDTKLHTALNDLDAALYAQSSTAMHYNASQLPALLQPLSNQEQNPDDKKTRLAPLYS